MLFFKDIIFHIVGGFLVKSLKLLSAPIILLTLFSSLSIVKALNLNKSSILYSVCVGGVGTPVLFFVQSSCVTLLSYNLHAIGLISHVWLLPPFNSLKVIPFDALSDSKGVVKTFVSDVTAKI